jgi:pSer/pThr/pTyr-binding forkhead associated (FHA) protein|tara:strand:+ start:2303 stop:3175 length:873 start_codon:yes stop_codon:yes gene_type:complete
MLKLRFKNNKHNAVWLVEPKVTIGMATDNNLSLTAKGVAAYHAEIVVNMNQLTLNNLANGKNVWLNGAPVVNKANLKAGDLLRIGSEELHVVDPKVKKTESPAIARDEESTGWALKANSSALSNRVFGLKACTTIGRSSDCDITLAASHLSRRHAELIVKNGQLYVKDLDSSNGTYLNGKRVSEAKIKRGDELRFDTLCFGIIGPAKDVDKTSVRSVRATPAKTKVKVSPAARKITTVSSAPVRKPNPQITEHASNEAGSHSLRQGLIIGLIVMAVIAVTFFTDAVNFFG